MGKKTNSTGRKWGTVWEFNTARLRVTLEIERDYNYQYDGDDPDSETQSKLDAGDYVAFDSRVCVYLGDAEEPIAWDSLCGSVYGRDSMAEFWTAHRDADPMNRNCSLMRAARGANVVICHYFPGMVSEALRAARKYIAEARDELPELRETA